MCNDAFPSEDQLTAHQVVKHGKPITEADEQLRANEESPRKEGQEERPKTKKKRGRKYTSNLQLQPVHEFLLQSERLRRPHMQVPYLHMPDMPTRLQDSART